MQLSDLTPLITWLILPPGGPVFAALAGLVIGLRWRTTGWVIAATAISTLYLLSTPLVSGWLVGGLNNAEPLTLTSAQHAQAIVVLGAGLSRDMNAPNGVSLGLLTSERVRYAARLFRELQLPLAVSGGVARADPAPRTEAALLQEALQTEYRLPVKWVEAQSRNTRENARLTAKILRPDGVSTIVLVTHAFDVRRARNEFEAAGLAVISAPTRVPFPTGLGGRALLPSIWALQDSHFAVYELLALIKSAITTQQVT